MVFHKIDFIKQFIVFYRHKYLIIVYLHKVLFVVYCRKSFIVVYRHKIFIINIYIVINLSSQIPSYLSVIAI